MTDRGGTWRARAPRTATTVPEGARSHADAQEFAERRASPVTPAARRGRLPGLLDATPRSTARTEPATPAPLSAPAGSPTAVRRPASTQRLAASWAGLRELGPLGLLFAAIVALPFAGTAILATTSNTWAPWFALDGAQAIFPAALAVALFVVATALLCGLSILPTYAVSMAGGYLYGSPVGSAVVLLGITLAAALGRVVMAWLAGERLMHYVTSKPKLAAVHQALLGDAATGVTTVVTLVRLAPVTPFAGTNLVMAAAKVAAGPFVTGTLLGLGPRVVLFVFAGAGLAELEFGEDSNPASLWLGGVSLLVSMAGLWVVAKRRLGAILDDPDGAIVPRFDPASHRHRRQVDDP